MTLNRSDIANGRHSALAALVRLLNLIGFGWLAYLFAFSLSGLAYILGVRNDASGWIVWPVVMGCLFLGYGLAVQTIDWIRGWEGHHNR